MQKGAANDANICREDLLMRNIFICLLLMQFIHGCALQKQSIYSSKIPPNYDSMLELKHTEATDRINVLSHERLSTDTDSFL